MSGQLLFLLVSGGNHSPMTTTVGQMTRPNAYCNDDIGGNLCFPVTATVCMHVQPVEFVVVRYSTSRITNTRSALNVMFSEGLGCFGLVRRSGIIVNAAKLDSNEVG